MKTVSQYKEEIKALFDRATKMGAVCSAEGRDFTDEEVTLREKIFGTIADYERIIKSLEQEEAISNKLSEIPQALTMPRPQRQTITVEDRAAKDKFNSFGQQMAAIMRAGIPGGRVDPRLLNAATGLSETVPSDGGFLVQQDFASEILKDVFQTGVLASRCRRVTISGNSNSIKINGMDETSRVAGSRQGGIRGYWADEAEEKTASKPKFRRIELNLKKMVGLCYATDELLDDAMALESIIREGFVSEFGFMLDDAIVNGTGSGQPLGILNSGSLVSVTKESGQLASTVMAENVINMYSRIFPQSRQNAVWLINQAIEPQLFTMSIAVGTGGVPVYLPAGGLSASPYGTLFGRPVLPIEQCAALGTVGDIILADLTNGYILAEKGGIESAMSIHVRFIYDESVFRFVMRVDGQPVRSSALTPYKGSATQSHFVALATRA